MAEQRKWDWHGYSSAFKDGKLYMPDMAWHDLNELAIGIFVINKDCRSWYVSKQGEKAGIRPEKVPLTKIVNYALTKEWKGRNHYKEWCEMVGWDNINLAMKFNGVGETNSRKSTRMELLQKIVVVEGFKELAERFPLAALLSCHLTPAQLRILVKRSDKEFMWYAPRMERKKKQRRSMKGIDAIYDRNKDHSAWIRPTKSHIKIMKKAPGFLLTKKEAKRIYIHILQNNGKRLPHIKRVNYILTSIMLNLDAREIKYTQAFLDDIGRRGALRKKDGKLRYESLDNWLRDTHYMLVELEQAGLPFQYSALKSIDDAYALHEEVVVEYTDKIRYPNLEFPKPPFEGSKYIVPIETSKELYREGRKMHHCVGSYAGSVANGGRYIYHVAFKGEEATLELKDNGEGDPGWTEPGWQIGQLYGPCNQYPSLKLRREVERWLEQSKEGKGRKAWPASLGDLIKDKLDEIAGEMEQQKIKELT